MFFLIKKFFSIFSITLFILTFLNSIAFGAVSSFVDDIDVPANGDNGQNQPTGVLFNPDGTKMYVTGISANRIIEFTLTTPFDVSEATFQAGEHCNFAGVGNDGTSAVFNSDGTKLFLAETAADDVEIFSLTTAYDISTCENESNQDFGGGLELRAIEFSNDGNKVFVFDMNGNSSKHSIKQYSLTGPFDLSNPTLEEEYIGPNGNIKSNIQQFAQGFAFSSDGTKMYITGGKSTSTSTAGGVYEFTLASPFDLSSTVTYEGEFAVGSEITKVSGIAFSSDGSKMFLSDHNAATAAVHEYNLTCGFGVITCIDPTSNKDDKASVESQSEASKKLIQHTTYPVLNRMEWLRRNKNSNNLTNQNIKFQFSNEILASLSNLIIPNYLNSNNSSLAEPQFGNWSYWSEGTVSIGKVGDTSTSSAKNVNTSAITIGADRKNDKNRMYGFAFRFGSDDIDVGNLGSALDMDALSLTFYETRPSINKMFMDSLIGISAINTGLLNNSGSTSTEGERKGKQIFASIKFRETVTKEKLNITPNVKVDLGVTSLSDYTETGAEGLNLKFYRQNIGTIITSVGTVIDNTIDINNGILKPNLNLEYNADISPSTKQKFEYASNETSYILENINSSTHNLKLGFGFDLTKDNGLFITTNYERNQSKGSGHTDTIYFAGSYVSKSDETYTFSLNGRETFNTKLDYKRNINGFDIKFASNYSLMSHIPDYGVSVEVSSRF